MSAKEFFGRVLNKTRQNLPSILTGVGLFNMFLGTGLAIKATPEAVRRIEEKKREEGHEYLTPAQTIQAVWKCYILALAAEVGGAACIISGLKENNKRNAALTLAMNSAEVGIREFNEYRRYVAERLGPKKEQEIHNQAVEQIVAQNPPPKEMNNRDFVEGVAPKPVCFDIDHGRYYYVDYETVAAAVNRLNQRINASLEGYVSLNDFYMEIDVPTIEAGEHVGWNSETGIIEIPGKDELNYAGTPGGWPCWVLEFVNPPQYEYKFFRKY